MASTVTLPFPLLPYHPPKSGTIKSTPVIGAVVSAKMGSHSQHGPGSSAAQADNSCGWWPSHAVGMASPVSTIHSTPVSLQELQELLSEHLLQPLRAQRKHSTVCWSRSLPLSLHLSHDFPDWGSPGDRHLGHRLHSQVNCSSKWSGKQCRKKEGKNLL